MRCAAFVALTPTRSRDADQYGFRAATGAATVPAMGEASPLPRWLCAGCGDTISVYEHAWVERSDRTRHPSSLLNLAEHVREQALRTWHAARVIDDSAAAAPDSP
jgi:hypothetical protein